MMNRRSFFRAMPFLAGAGVVAAMVPDKTAVVLFVEQPITKRIRCSTDCDLSILTVENGIAEIIKVAGVVPEAYRLTCGPYWYPRSKEVSQWFQGKANLLVEVHCDSKQQYLKWTDIWTLEGAGVLFWSPGA